MKSHFDPVSYEGEKIVTASQMAEMEKRAIAENDATGDEYMQKAADGIFAVVRTIMIERVFASKVIIFVGKGNNGGDGLSVGIRLLADECEVVAYLLSPIEECSELCQKYAKKFEKAGGTLKVLENSDQVEFSENAIVIDALLGTGFQGSVKGLMSEVIEKINQAHNYIVSIDIPSGVSGNTGKVEGSAVYADHTIYLGLIKVGHLFYDGYDHVGELSHVEFGISEKYIDELKPFGFLVNPQIMTHNLPRHRRTSHKYSIGELVVVGGSSNMAGAALLSSEAGLRSGAGIVKWFFPAEAKNQQIGGLKEIIKTPFNLECMDALKEELTRAKAALIGPGLGRSAQVPKLIEAIYSSLQCPIVVDADALFFYQKPPTKAVLTPHKGELMKLLGIEDTKISQLDILDRAQAFCDEHDVVIVAKGAPTAILAKKQPRIVSARGNPGMATAGSGDVLGGIIAAFLAQGMEPRGAAILGVTFHAIAGDLARDHKSEHAMIASDIIAELPTLFLRCETA